MIKRLLPFLLTLLLALPAFGQAVPGTPNSPVFAQTPNRGVLQFTHSSTATTYATAYTAGAKGSKIMGISMNNNDGSATHLVTCQIFNATVAYGGVALTSTESAGFASGTNGQSLLSATLFPGGFTDANGNYALLLVNGDTLQCTFATTITSSDVLNILVTAVDF